MNTKHLKIQQRVDTSSQWEINNPVLLNREIGYESDTGNYKIGDGSSTWNDLIYQSNILRGIEDNSIKNLTGEVISKNTIALGTSTAGSKCFTIIGFDETNKAYTLDSTTGLAIDDIFSLKMKNNYDNIGRITAIDGKKVTVDNFIANDNGSIKQFRIPLKPNCGTTDFGVFAMAIGQDNSAVGDNAIAFGKNTKALGRYAFTSGKETEANYAAHAEGVNTKASGPYSHAQGSGTTASGYYSHAEGWETVSSSDCSHAEGSGTIASGPQAHAEGYKTTAGKYSHAEGYNTYATNTSHAEGKKSRAEGNYSHAEGNNTIASGYYSHAEGFNTIASRDFSHAEGCGTKTYGYYSHAEGYGGEAFGECSHAEGANTQALGLRAHAEGNNTIASGLDSHSEGLNTEAAGDYSHTEGSETKTEGKFAHAEGYTTKALGQGSHTEGYSTQANGFGAHAEGRETKAMGTLSHSEGYSSIASGNYSHVEGYSTKATKDCGHAEGSFTVANGLQSHAEGLHTTANGNYQHVEGKYNIEDTNNKYAHITGNGVKDSLSNAYTLDWSGNAWFAGDVTATTSNGEISMNQIFNKINSFSSSENNKFNYIEDKFDGWTLLEVNDNFAYFYQWQRYSETTTEDVPSLVMAGGNLSIRQINLYTNEIYQYNTNEFHGDIYNSKNAWDIAGLTLLKATQIDDDKLLIYGIMEQIVGYYYEDTDISGNSFQAIDTEYEYCYIEQNISLYKDTQEIVFDNYSSLADYPLKEDLFANNFHTNMDSSPFYGDMYIYSNYRTFTKDSVLEGEAGKKYIFTYDLKNKKIVSSYTTSNNIKIRPKINANAGLLYLVPGYYKNFITSNGEIILTHLSTNVPGILIDGDYYGLMGETKFSGFDQDLYPIVFNNKQKTLITNDSELLKYKTIIKSNYLFLFITNNILAYKKMPI